MEYRYFWSEFFKQRPELYPPGYDEAVIATVELTKKKAQFNLLTAKEKKKEEEKKKKEKEKKAFFANSNKKVKTRKEEEEEGYGW